MIYGIGVDIVKVSRFKNLINNKSFKNKVFTELELKTCRYSLNKLASNFAAKEAIVKITGLGFKGANPTEIEILHDKNGAPKVKLYGKTKEKFEELKIKKIHLSISHTKDIVISYAIGEG